MLDPAHLQNTIDLLFWAGNKKSSSFNEVNFVKSKFLYNTRILAIWIPCLLVVLAYGGKVYVKQDSVQTNSDSTFGTILFGAMVCWIFDAIGLREG